MNFWHKIVQACRDLSMDCHAAAHAQSEMLDHPLNGSRRAGLRVHLLLCKWCRRYGRQIRFMHTAGRRNPGKLEEADQRTLSETARARIKAKLRDGR